MNDMTAKEEFIFLFKAYLKQAEADVKKWTEHLERLEGKKEPVAKLQCSDRVIKPCPFCGGKLFIFRGLKTFIPMCSRVGCIASKFGDCYGKTEEEAIEIWEKRAL